MENYRHFTLIVAGDNPDELIEKYDNNLKVERHLVYRFANAEKYYNTQLKALNEVYNNPSSSDTLHEIVGLEISELKEMDPIEYYSHLTEDYEIDEETGDAYSEDNENGKYDGIQEGGIFALPLINKDGEETYHCVKSEIDWDKIHLTNTRPYEVAWDCVMEEKAPQDDFEKGIYNNMKNRVYYFEQFGNRENYIKANTAFWGYAFLSEKTGWVELESNQNQFEWVSNFYDRFIEPLDDNTMISVYECTRKPEEGGKSWAKSSQE